MFKKTFAVVCVLAVATAVSGAEQKRGPKFIEALPTTATVSTWESVLNVTNVTVNGVSYSAKKYDLANVETSTLMVDYAAFKAGATLTADQQASLDIINVYDSTAAFKAAASLTVAADPSAPPNTVDTSRRVVNLWGTQVVCPKVVIPAGIYLVTDEISFGPGSTVQGDGEVIIIQLDPSKRTFVFSKYYKVIVSSIQFEGGTNALWFENQNVDGSFITLRDCGFKGTMALPVAETRDPSDYSGFAVVAVPIAPAVPLSTTFMMERCKWMGCYAGLLTTCDATIMNACWIQWYDRRPSDSTPDPSDISPDPFNEFFILNKRGVLTINNVTQFIPNFNPALQGRDSSKHCWIKNWGSVYASTVKFGGEFGGVRIICHAGNPSQTDPFAGQSIVLEKCQLSAGLAAVINSAVITLQDGFPRTITIRDCNNLYLLTNVKLIAANNDSLAQNIAALMHPISGESPFEGIEITITGNQTRSMQGYRALRRENLSLYIPACLVQCVNRF